MLFEIEYHGLVERHALPGKDHISIMKYPEYIETFAILEKHEVLENEIFKVSESSL